MTAAIGNHCQLCLDWRADIPRLGVLISIVVTLIGLGALLLVFREGAIKPAAPQVALTPA